MEINFYFFVRWLHYYSVIVGYGFTSVSAALVLAKLLLYTLDHVDRVIMRVVHEHKLLWIVIHELHKRPRPNREA